MYAFKATVGYTRDVRQALLTPVAAVGSDRRPRCGKGDRVGGRVDRGDLEVRVGYPQPLVLAVVRLLCVEDADAGAVLHQRHCQAGGGESFASHQRKAVRWVADAPLAQTADDLRRRDRRSHVGCEDGRLERGAGVVGDGGFLHLEPGNVAAQCSAHEGDLVLQQVHAVMWRPRGVDSRQVGHLSIQENAALQLMGQRSFERLEGDGHLRAPCNHAPGAGPASHGDIAGEISHGCQSIERSLEVCDRRSAAGQCSGGLAVVRDREGGARIDTLHCHGRRRCRGRPRRIGQGDRHRRDVAILQIKEHSNVLQRVQETVRVGVPVGVGPGGERHGRIAGDVVQGCQLGHKIGGGGSVDASRCDRQASCRRRGIIKHGVVGGRRDVAVAWGKGDGQGVSRFEICITVGVGDRHGRGQQTEAIDGSLEIGDLLRKNPSGCCRAGGEAIGIELGLQAGERAVSLGETDHEFLSLVKEAVGVAGAVVGSRDLAGLLQRRGQRTQRRLNRSRRRPADAVRGAGDGRVAIRGVDAKVGEGNVSVVVGPSDGHHVSWIHRSTGVVNAHRDAAVEDTCGVQSILEIARLGAGLEVEGRRRQLRGAASCVDANSKVGAGDREGLGLGRVDKVAVLVLRNICIGRERRSVELYWSDVALGVSPRYRDAISCSDGIAVSAGARDAQATGTKDGLELSLDLRRSVCEHGELRVRRCQRRGDLHVAPAIVAVEAEIPTRHREGLDLRNGDVAALDAGRDGRIRKGRLAEVAQNHVAERLVEGDGDCVGVGDGRLAPAAGDRHQASSELPF
eukprot:scaffold1102_cov256-Pinguiococcus_pyrenoidosus.AAC.10